jgi:hypothetical protein
VPTFMLTRPLPLPRHRNLPQRKPQLSCSYCPTKFPPNPNIMYAMKRTATTALPISSIVCLSTATSLYRDCFARIPDQKCSQIRTVAPCHRELSTCSDDRVGPTAGAISKGVGG